MARDPTSYFYSVQASSHPHTSQTIERIQLGRLIAVRLRYQCKGKTSPKRELKFFPCVIEYGEALDSEPKRNNLHKAARLLCSYENVSPIYYWPQKLQNFWIFHAPIIQTNYLIKEMDLLPRETEKELTQPGMRD